ncbi:hypothetical protein Q3G72_035249 [Acer saccharum]|nr:hypothetical protein Q3G72_035249 [Acer saccharum]
MVELLTLCIADFSQCPSFNRSTKKGKGVTVEPFHPVVKRKCSPKVVPWERIRRSTCQISLDEEGDVPLMRSKRSRADEVVCELIEELEGNDKAFAYAMAKLELCVVDMFKRLSTYDATVYWIIKDIAAKTLASSKKSRKQWRAHCMSLRKNPLPLHFEMPNSLGVLKEYSHMDQLFAFLQGLYSVGPVCDNHYDSLRARKFWCGRVMSFLLVDQAKGLHVEETCFDCTCSSFVIFLLE